MNSGPKNQRKVSILTNARAARQASMIGYGRLLLKELAHEAYSLDEVRAVSLIGAPRQLPFRKHRLNLDRFVLTPAAVIGRSTDLLHIVDPGNSLYMSMVRSRSTVVTVHDMIPYLCLLGELRGFVPSTTGRLAMARIVRALRTADALVAVSTQTKLDLSRIAGVEEGKVHVIPNAVFQKMEPALPDKVRMLRSSLLIPENAPVILHIGRSFYKNRPTVLSVFDALADRVPESRLVLIGGADAELSKTIARSRRASDIIVVETVSADALPVFYTLASVLLFPSLYEGFGLPVVESQLCGTPVVCSDGGSLPEVVGEGGKVFSPFDIAGMSGLIAHIITSKDASAELSAKGLKNAQRFSREAWRDAYLFLYERLLANAL